MTKIESFVEEILAKRGSKFVQLVKHVDEVPEAKIKFPAIMQTKYDGVFCAMIVIDGVAKAYSRTGNKFTNLEHIEADFEGYDDGVYIGEVVNYELSLEVLSGAVNCNRVKPLDDSIVSSMMNSTRIALHDKLSIQEFRVGYASCTYANRYEELASDVLFNATDGAIILVPCHTCESLEQFKEFAESKIRLGHEGAVLKQDCDYEAGHKGYRVMKYVRGIHLDLECIGAEYGKGKRTGQIAALIFKYNGREFKADLGKGWTDELRIKLTAEFDANMNAVIGKIFHIKGLQISSKGVIRLPKVQEMRIDKTHSD